VSDAPQAFASFEQKWLEANPEQATVALFLAPGLRLRASAFGCLVHELSFATYEIREPQVAATKLAWWAQELAGAASGQARHPITQVLFDEAVLANDRVLWPALAESAMTQLDAASAPTLDELLAQSEPFYIAIAAAESALFLGASANINANAALWTISHLLHVLPGLAQSDLHLPVPLDLLARHGLTRTDLLQPSVARSALVKDHLAALKFEIDGAHGVVSTRTLAQRVRVRLDRVLIAGATRALEPLAYLSAHPRAGRWRSLWYAWRAARAVVRAG
jgi:15-cis-phytoene synthase